VYAVGPLTGATAGPSRHPCQLWVQLCCRSDDGGADWEMVQLTTGNSGRTHYYPARDSPDNYNEVFFSSPLHFRELLDGGAHLTKIRPIPRDNHEMRGFDPTNWLS